MDSLSLGSYGAFALLPLSSWLGYFLISRTQPGSVRMWSRICVGFAAITTTLLLILSAIGGSFLDISHLWPFLWRALLAAVPLIAIWRCGFLEPPSYIAVLRTIWALIAIPGIGLFLILCLALPTCNRRPSPIYSPDGKYVAILEFLEPGVFDDDHATVKVRRSWWPFATEVYSGYGGWDPSNPANSTPKVRWIGDSRLLVHFYQSSGHSDSPCLGLKRDPEVICEPDTSSK